MHPDSSQEASEADGELWKVDTAGDAYIVVGGVGTGTQLPDLAGDQSAASTPSLVAQQRSLVRARALLDRVFVLAHAMQVRLQVT